MRAMSSLQAARNVIRRSPGLSRANLWRFSRPRHHGITCSNPASYLGITSRPFSCSQRTNSAVKHDEGIRSILEDYKSQLQVTSWEHSDITFEKVRDTPVGEEVKLFGYLTTRRDVNKKLAFSVLRHKDHSWCIQLVSNSNEVGVQADAHHRLRSVKRWTPVRIRGVVQKRQPAKEDTYQGMKLVNTCEILVTHVEPLNTMPDDIIMKDETVFRPDQRHLQLRTDDEIRSNLLFRSKVVHEARAHLDSVNWKEIETPILFKSTPEGAREFLVPTRSSGLAYALPQSPQQYKQILMASGITKYFQFARCFRDEDLRADRQPEFTQLDMEMSFADEETVMHEIEKLLHNLWQKLLGQSIPQPIPRMTYAEAMTSYGVDKPDLRYEARIIDVTQSLPADLIGKITPLEKCKVEGIKLPISSDAKTTRKFITKFLDSPEGKPFLQNPDGQPGVFISDHSKPMQGLGPLGYQYVMEGPEALALEHGDLLILQARPDAPHTGGSTMLGNLRLALYKAAIQQGLIEPPANTDFRFVWITDFPLFTPSNDTDPGQGGASGFSSTHHPFTAPKTSADVDMLLEDPSAATAAHYDIVVNGVELGGGSRRIHNAAMQEFIFRDILQMESRRIEDFRHLLDVLRSGCPPHAGLALGWDRLVAVMLGKDSVRDVIAFPKTGSGEDPLVKSPNAMTEKQLSTYHLKLKE